MVMNLGELLRTRNLPRKFWKVTQSLISHKKAQKAQKYTCAFRAFWWLPCYKFPETRFAVGHRPLDLDCA